MRRNKTVKYLALSALFAAAVFVVTAYLPRIPIVSGSGGYIHLGDVFIYIAATLLPLPYAVAAASVGAALADVIGGFIIWAPATAVIKALAVPAFGCGHGKIFRARNIAAAGIAGLVNIAGYYLYEAVFITDFAVAAVSVPFNLIQSAAAMLLFMITAPVLDRIKVNEFLDL